MRIFSSPKHSDVSTNRKLWRSKRIAARGYQRETQNTLLHKIWSSFTRISDSQRCVWFAAVQPTPSLKDHRVEASDSGAGRDIVMNLKPVMWIDFQWQWCLFANEDGSSHGSFSLHNVSKLFILFYLCCLRDPELQKWRTVFLKIKKGGLR